MASPFPNLPPERRGRLALLRPESEALRGNPWGDPTVRDLWVHHPAGFPAEQPLPAILVLPPFGSTGEKLLARGLHDASIAARADRLHAGGGPPFRLVLPDTMSTLAGTQYVDSPGIGRYAAYVADEVVAAVEAAWPTTAWGITGRSSGGFGALHLVMARPGRFRAAACQSGDLGFDLAYGAEWIPALRALAEAGGPRRFLERFWAGEEASHLDHAAINLLCLAAAYGDGEPDPSAPEFPGRLPFDLATGTTRPEVLASWQRFDPALRASGPEGDALAALDLLLVDVGDRDEYGLQWGARRLVQALRARGVEPGFEEYRGGHRGTAWRVEGVLPRLARALSS